MRLGLGSDYIHATDSGLRLASQRLSDTFDEKSITFLRYKLNECIATHTACHTEPEKDPGYPTRLLNLKGHYQSKVTLEDTSEKTQGPYFTLSHCWGGLQPIRLTRESEQSLRDGISLHDLPKTFREAIELCQTFDISYLWIDSMCIFQDDLKD